FVRRPCCPVLPQERSARTLFATEAESTVAQSVHEPLESHRYLDQLATEFGSHAVNHATTHQRFADCGLVWPIRPMTKEIGDRHSEVLIRVQEPSTASDDPVAGQIGVVGEGNIETV